MEAVLRNKGSLFFDRWQHSDLLFRIYMVTGWGNRGALYVHWDCFAPLAMTLSVDVVGLLIAFSGTRSLQVYLEHRRRDAIS